MARARVASIASSSRLPLPRAPSVRRSSAARQACSSRVARMCSSRAICGLAHRGVVDRADVDLGLVVEAVLVDADDGLVAQVDAGLAACRGLLDPELRHAGLDGLRHPAERLDLLDQLPRVGREGVGERFDVVRAAERVDHVGDAGLLGDDQLRVAGGARRGLGGERDRLVEAVRVQALRAAEHRGERLDGRPHDVVVRVLLRERDARRLAVRAQHQRRRASSGRTAT